MSNRNPAHAIPAIAHLFRTRRRAKDITLRDMMPLVGMNYSHISRIERGQRQVQLEHLDAFCGALDIPRWLPRALLLLEGLTDEERQAMLAAVAIPGMLEAFPPGA